MGCVPLGTFDGYKNQAPEKSADLTERLPEKSWEAGWILRMIRAEAEQILLTHTIRTAVMKASETSHDHC